MPDRVTIVVTSKQEVSSGTSRTGRDWTLYLLTATDPSGAPLNLDGKLKSFDDIPEGQAVSVELERSESDQYGVEYMARQKGGPSAGKSLEEHRQRIDALESRVNWLIGAVRAAGIDIDAAAAPSPAAPEPGPEPADPGLLPGQSSGGAFANDDDIPFAKPPWPSAERVTWPRFRRRRQWDSLA